MSGVNELTFEKVVNELSHDEGKGVVFRFLRNTGLIKRV